MKHRGLYPRWATWSCERCLESFSIAGERIDDAPLICKRCEDLERAADAELGDLLEDVETIEPTPEPPAPPART